MTVGVNLVGNLLQPKRLIRKPGDISEIGFGDGEYAASVGSQVVGEVLAAELPPEVRRVFVQELTAGEQAMAEIGEAVLGAID